MKIYSNFKRANAVAQSRADEEGQAMGGETAEIGQFVHGAPRLQQGDEVVIFFRASNTVCQVAGWAEGIFYVAQHNGQPALVTEEGRLVLGVDAAGIKVGLRHATWSRKNVAATVVPNETPAAEAQANVTAAAATVDGVKKAIATVAQSLGKRPARATATKTAKGRADALQGTVVR